MEKDAELSLFPLLPTLHFVSLASIFVLRFLQTGRNIDQHNVTGTAGYHGLYTQDPSLPLPVTISYQAVK